LELYRQLSEVYPGDAQVLHGLGLSLLEQGMVDEGLQRLATAVALQPDNPLLQEDLGTAIWEHRRDAQAAIPALERAAALAPGNRRAANLLARIRATQSPTP
jgi:Flp pilus assembly protein TadD